MNTNYTKRMQHIQESIAIIGNGFDEILSPVKPEIPSSVVTYIDNTQSIINDVKINIEMLYADETNVDYVNGFNDAIARVLSILNCKIKE